MKNVRLIRWMYRFSSFLLYLEGALLFLFTIVIPLMITGQSYWSDKTLPNHQRIHYDTTLRASLFSNSSFTMSAINNQGQLISRVERDSNLIVYYDANQQVIDQFRLDSLRRLLRSLPTDNVPAQAQQRAVAYQQQLTRQIDSVLIANPDAIIRRMPDRWLLQPVLPSGFGWSMAVPLYSDIWLDGNADFEHPQQWQRALSYRPYVSLSQNINKRVPFVLQASVHRWSDLNSFIWPLMLLSVLWVLFFLILSMLITQWFREIFADLLNGEFFAERITQRVQQSGWLFVGGFILSNGIDVFQPILAQQYLQTQGYASHDVWVWNGPDHWLLLCSGLVLLVFAQVFQYGTQLQRENELTI